MSAINFPDPSQSPWTNSSTGITYTYSNGVWKALSSEETFLKTTDAESTYLKQADANFVSLNDGGTQQVISGGGGLNVDGDVQKKGNTVPSAVMGATAPSNPGICDFWTDTSGDTPVLKSWNGTEWVEVGSSGASEFAPVISNVTLTENDTTGDRFTSQTFDVDITMLREGEPFSQKGLKGEVTAEFSVHPNTEPIASNNVITYPNTQQTITAVGAEKSHTRVYVPNAQGGYSWYYIKQQQGGNEYTYVIENSEPGTSNGTQVYQSGSSGPEVWRPQVFPPIANSLNWYVVASPRNLSSYKHLLMTKTPTGDWTFSSTGNSRSAPCQDPSTGYFASVREGGWTGGGYRIYIDIGTSPFNNNIVSTYITGSGRNDYYAAMFGNGKYVALFKNYYDSEYYAYYYDSSGNSLGNSGQKISAFGTHSINWYKFVKDLFFVYNSSGLHKSTDGLNWTTMSLPVSYLDSVCDIRYNSSTNKYQLYGQISNNIYVFESNNAGATWVQVKGYNAGYQLPYCTFGDSKIVYYGKDNSGNFWEYSFPYNKQTLTLSGTGADYSDFNVGDAIRPVGQYGIAYQGTINSISGTTIDISSDGYIYQAGDVIEAVNPTNSQTATRYLVIDSTGAVSGTVGSDPGYASVGPNINQTLTFPATFDTGNSPDDELPVGTTFKVSAQATNSIGSSEFGPSNIITPA